jgi:hypothetical protein
MRTSECLPHCSHDAREAIFEQLGTCSRNYLPDSRVSLCNETNHVRNSAMLQHRSRWMNRTR